MVSDLVGAAVLMGYYLGAVVLIPTIFKYWLRVPLEYIRKFQHVAYSLSIFILLQMFSAWYFAVGAAFLLVILAYPALLIFEKSKIYRRLFVERANGKGELRMQLILVQLTFAILIFIFWGLLGAGWQYVVAVAIMAWGFGDAAAALIGKAFGKRRYISRYIEKAKTCEGLAAMIIAAGLALFFTLYFYAGVSWLTSLIIAIIVAPGCGIVELFSRRGSDTLTVPLFASALVFPLLYLFGFLGW